MRINAFHKLLFFLGTVSILAVLVLAFLQSDTTLEWFERIRQMKSTQIQEVQAIGDSETTRVGSRTDYEIGVYADVYRFLDTLDPVANRGLIMQQDTDGIFRMINRDDTRNFNILQLTDIHLTGADNTYREDIQAIDAIYTMVERSQPDFIVITGDFIFATQYTNPQEDARAFNVLCTLMDDIGIPWTWAFGNHDHTFFERYSIDEVGQLMKRSSTLYMYEKNYSISGYSNGVFEFCNSDGSLNQGLIVLDSLNLLTEENGQILGYDYIRDDQVAWYSAQVTRMNEKYNTQASTMLFFHIPLREYDEAWNLFENTEANTQIENSVTYVYGEKREEVSCSPVESSLFARAVQLKSTVAIFCGHDHTNDFSVIYQGIQLVYGKSIDYVAYEGIAQKTQQRGATLITLSPEGGYCVTPQLFEYK